MKKLTPVYGTTVTAPRPTKAVAIFLATTMAIPVFIVINLIEWLWF